MVMEYATQLVLLMINSWSAIQAKIVIKIGNALSLVAVAICIEALTSQIQ